MGVEIFLIGELTPHTTLTGYTVIPGGFDELYRHMFTACLGCFRQQDKMMITSKGLNSSTDGVVMGNRRRGLRNLQPCIIHLRTSELDIRNFV